MRSASASFHCNTCAAGQSGSMHEVARAVPLSSRRWRRAWPGCVQGRVGGANESNERPARTSCGATGARQSVRRRAGASIKTYKFLARESDGRRGRIDDYKHWHLCECAADLLAPTRTDARLWPHMMCAQVSCSFVGGPSIHKNAPSAWLESPTVHMRYM